MNSATHFVLICPGKKALSRPERPLSCELPTGIGDVATWPDKAAYQIGELRIRTETDIHGTRRSPAKTARRYRTFQIQTDPHYTNRIIASIIRHINRNR